MATTPGRRRAEGQSLAEFALLVPLFLLVMGGALDLGRLFYAHVAIENAAKEGALYAASNPRCDVPKEGCVDPNTVRWHVEQEAVGIPGLSHSVVCLEDDGDTEDVDDCRPGDRYRVSVEADFQLVTPILVPLLGSTLELRSTAVSEVRVGAFDPDATPIPIPTPTPSPTPSPSPTGTPGLGPTPSPTPRDRCTVPDLVGEKLDDARDLWADAGFTGSVLGGGSNGNKRVQTQSLQAGSSEPCTSGITVTTS